MNVLCLGSRIIGPSTAEVLVKAFLSADFIVGDNKYQRRLDKVLAIEEAG